MRIRSSAPVRPSTPWLRLAAVLALLFGYLGSAAHLAFERHTVCPDHGLEHEDSDDGHDVCGLILHRVDQAVLDGAASLSPLGPVALGAPALAPARVPPAKTTVWRLAPKTSPPPSSS